MSPFEQINFLQVNSFRFFVVNILIISKIFEYVLLKLLYVLF